MTRFRDLSGNGTGVEVEPKFTSVPFAAGDQTISGKMRYLRANGAGNVTIRPAGASADIVVPAKDGEYIPIDPGTIVRNAGTTVVSLLATA